MESLSSHMAKLDRTSWAISMVTGGLAFIIVMLLLKGYLVGGGRVVAVTSLIVLIPIWLATGAHFVIAFIRQFLSHGNRRNDA